MLQARTKILLILVCRFQVHLIQTNYGYVSGRSGHVLTAWDPNYLFVAGTWHPQAVYSATGAEDFGTGITATVAAMERMEWIDMHTALVETSCNIWNPNNNLQANAFYSVEFLNTGRVNPLQPKITLSRVKLPPINTVSVGLFVAYYYLMHEVQDMIMKGMRTYISKNGWLNLIDWACILSALVMEVSYFVYLGKAPDTSIPYNSHYWSLASQQESAKISTGLALFFVLFRVLKYSKNIPVMCVIGEHLQLGSHSPCQLSAQVQHSPGQWWTLQCFWESFLLCFLHLASPSMLSFLLMCSHSVI